jgi:hypothetical protein
MIAIQIIIPLNETQKEEVKNPCYIQVDGK